MKNTLHIDDTAAHSRSKLLSTGALGLLLLSIAVLVACSGCSKFDIDKLDMTKNIPWGEGKDGAMKAPMKVVAVWTDTVLTEGMKPATRGFGGRLMFYDVEGGKPIKVKGTLTVYAFDETGRDVEQTKPDRKYVFTTEQFEKHYSKSSLGHSYSVWLPWDAAGGPLKEISLLVRFTPEKAPVVIGEAAKQHLPGVRLADPTKYPDVPTAQAVPSGVPGVLPHIAVGAQSGSIPNNAPNAGGVQLVGYDAPVAQANANAGNQPRRMSTTTISLPSSNDALRNSGFAQQPRNVGAANGAATGYSAPNYPAASGYPAPMGLPATMWSAGPNAMPVGLPTAAPTQPAALQPGALQPAAGSQSSSPGSASTHFGPGRLRPLGAPLARLERDRAPWQPNLAAPQSAPQGSR